MMKTDHAATPSVRRARMLEIGNKVGYAEGEYDFILGLLELGTRAGQFKWIVSHRAVAAVFVGTWFAADADCATIATLVSDDCDYSKFSSLKLARSIQARRS